MVTLRTGPTLEQAERWVAQWDRLQTMSSSRHLRVSTLASSSVGKWKQGMWAMHQLRANGHTVWRRREAEWIRMIQHKHDNLAELVPWVQQFELQKYTYNNNNRESDKSKVTGVRRTIAMQAGCRGSKAEP